MLKNKKDSLISVMLDSNIFDKLLIKENFDRLPKNVKYYATNIQLEEIKRIPDVDHRKNILDIFHIVVDEEADSIDEGILQFGHSNFSASFCSKNVENSLNYLHNGNESHIADALIILTAKQYECILVSNNKDTPFKRSQRGHELCLMLRMPEAGPKNGKLYLDIQNDTHIIYRTTLTSGNNILVVEDEFSQENWEELKTSIERRKLNTISDDCKDNLLETLSRKNHVVSALNIKIMSLDEFIGMSSCHNFA